MQKNLFGLKVDSLSLIAFDGEKVNLQYNGSQKSAYQFLSDEQSEECSVHYGQILC